MPVDDRIDAVLFDVDDTLCRYRRSGAEVLALAYEAVGVDPLFTVEVYVDRFADYLESCSDGDDLRERCFADLAAERGHDPDLGRAVAAAYAEERDQTNVDPLPGAREVVEILAEEYRVGVVTNGPREMQLTKLRAIGLDDVVEVVVAAGFECPPKPSPEPFETALASLDVEPDRAVHVSNSLGSDVAGAHAAGLESAWLADGFDGTPEPEPTYELAELTDLLSAPWTRAPQTDS